MKGFLLFVLALALCACVAVPVLYFTTDIFTGESSRDGAGGGSQIARNPGVRVVLNKAQALEDCEPFFRPPGEFYFVVVVTDGQTSSDLRIPSSGNYPLYDGDTVSINRVCFSTPEVGDYLQLVVVGFEEDSGICYGTYVVSAAGLLPLSLSPGTAGGTGTLLSIVEQLRGGEGFWCDKDDYAGGCDRTWYSSQNWGVGSHQLANGYMRFWITIEQY